MAHPMRISYLNRADPPGIVTASSAQSLLPASNLQTADVRELWRATTTTPNIILDMGQSLTLHVVALLRSNLAAADTVRVRMSVTDAAVTSSLSYDSGTLTPAIDTTHKRFVHWIEPGVAGRYLRLDLTQAALPEAGRLVASRTWTPSSNFQYGWLRTWRDPSRAVESLGQARFTDIRGRRRGFAFRLTGLTEVEVTDEIEEINRIAGISKDVLVCRDRFASNLGRETLWGPLEAPITPSQPQPLLYDAEFSLYDRDRLP